MFLYYCRRMNVMNECVNELPNTRNTQRSRVLTKMNHPLQFHIEYVRAHSITNIIICYVHLICEKCKIYFLPFIVLPVGLLLAHCLYNYIYLLCTIYLICLKLKNQFLPLTVYTRPIKSTLYNTNILICLAHLICEKCKSQFLLFIV